MSIADIFEREIVGKDGETKKINEIIDVSKHTWSTQDGNIIMKHEAVLLLRKFTGAKFLKPELQKEISNPGNVVYLCIVEFPNGEISYEIGESNNENTKGWSKGIKPTMAFKRGHDRAFLRSDYIGLFEVFSEEESESFKKVEKPQYNSSEQPIEQNVASNNSSITTVISPNPALFLPGTDSKYPGEHIVEDILKKHQDFEYLVTIPNSYPNNKDYVNIVNIIMKKREEKLKKKQQEAESSLNSESFSAEDENNNSTKNVSVSFDTSSPTIEISSDIIDEEKLKEAQTDAESFLNGSDDNILVENQEHTEVTSESSTDTTEQDLNS